MGKGGWGIGRLGLWMQLRRMAGQDSPPAPEIPQGPGPLLLVHVAADARLAFAQVQRRLMRARPDLRILDPGDPGPQAANALMRADPAALLLLGSDLPPVLISAASRHEVPVILAEARFAPDDAGWSLHARRRRELLRQARAILVTDPASQAIALRMGAGRKRVAMTGPVAEIRDPLPCSEAERSIMAGLLRGRHAWLAASVPPDEEDAVLDAHLAALAQSHRALLFLAPRDPDRIDPLAARIESGGLVVARRSLDEDPTDDVHVMLTDGPTEMGLWYRLAPVTYLGGTLSGDDAAARHPFEPAALGSAIVHGPRTERFATEWQQLGGAGAARQVGSPDELATAIAELSQPDLIATLASNAWTVSTGGADVTMRICAPVLDAIGKPRP
ncbi:3-deoxy-D-manno-octulosonic acid transferase [Paracoccus sediminis]|uniref:3-deoxy-D-manno-octulosonic acid transferase n=1 Tax=Paracoccus sediminis TaxID=1214787 RepID=A0A238UMA9_9RHOB|nr:glycosyltransferase N-terminal domain-containing protein [Paracoccus sediminis]TBN53080.1 3-deoxy-D-manno-octulosonic acid transferase [Paracoccus sediminis]SNR23246.1 3-deoxy-D-manno-octulosonic-acid transferase [Paracoccus sediminis]